MKAVRITAGLAVVLTYGLIVLGALVRSTESGLSCPDWPTCYGHWVLTPADYATLPDTGYTYVQIMLEWVHRLVAGVILGPLVLLLSALVFARAGKYPTLAWAAALLILLLVVQAGLGRFTVLDQNSPWSVALHLGTALLVITTMLFLFVRSREAPTRAPAVGLLSALAWVTALAAMLTAAVTAKSGASLACATWPLCDGAIVPDLSDPLVRIHVAHRALAAATGVLILLLAVVAARTPCRGAGPGGPAPGGRPDSARCRPDPPPGPDLGRRAASGGRRAHLRHARRSHVAGAAACGSACGTHHRRDDAWAGITRRLRSGSAASATSRVRSPS